MKKKTNCRDSAIKPKCKPKRNEKLFNKTKNKFFI